MAFYPGPILISSLLPSRSSIILDVPQSHPLLFGAAEWNLSVLLRSPLAAAGDGCKLNKD